MSRTYPAPAKAAPRDEAGQLRELTREAHEAAKDARAALRELRAERDRLRADMVRGAADYCDAILAELADQFRQSRETLTHFQHAVEQRTTQAVEAIEYNHAHLAGFKTTEEMQQWLITTISSSIIGALADNRVFVHEVAACVVARANAVKRKLGAPEVVVATREQLDRFTAAGGDPGLVLDLRENKRG